MHCQWCLWLQLFVKELSPQEVLLRLNFWIKLWLKREMKSSLWMTLQVTVHCSLRLQWVWLIILSDHVVYLFELLKCYLLDIYPVWAACYVLAVAKKHIDYLFRSTISCYTVWAQVQHAVGSKTMVVIRSKVCAYAMHPITARRALDRVQCTALFTKKPMVKQVFAFEACQHTRWRWWR